MTDNITKEFDKALDRLAKAYAERERAQQAYQDAVLKAAAADLVIDKLFPLLPKEDQ